jgi:hypothetical protein
MQVPVRPAATRADAATARDIGGVARAELISG